jgi:hypothetical protein
MKNNEKLTLWNDAYQNGHQFIANFEKIALYERYMGSKEMEYNGITITISCWGKWHKVSDPERMSKAWFVREMTIEDAILENYDNKPS